MTMGWVVKDICSVQIDVEWSLWMCRIVVVSIEGENRSKKKLSVSVQSISAPSRHPPE